MGVTHTQNYPHNYHLIMRMTTMMMILTINLLILLPTATFAIEDDNFTPSPSSRATGSPFIWQPLPLRATFRPLNRQPSESAPAAPASSFRPPRPPRPPSPPTPPEPVVSSISERSISSDTSSASENLFQPTNNRFSSSSADSPFSSSFFQPPFEFSTTPPTTVLPTTTTTTTTSTTTTPRPNGENSGDDFNDELPTRQPMNRFRPTRAPSDDNDDNSSSNSNSAQATGGATGASNNLTTSSSRTISSECFECICEASTNCNSNSRCQTSDVRHTRCGMFLISYDQWLTTGLSRELVSREALARDGAADERAFYECVTQRECAERLLGIYLQRQQKDCDKDGRVDCFDMAAIHHSGLDQCASESLLDSQYWSDFNACLGFGRRRRRRR